jgi:hypothetical protein
VIVNAARASLSFAEGARITATNGGVFIYNGDGEHIYTDPINQGFKVKYVINPLEGAQGTDAYIAVPSYRIRTTPVAPHITDLYVVGTVTVDPGVPAPTGVGGDPSIHALGEVELTGSNFTVFDANFFNFTTTAVLTSTVPGGVTIAIIEPDTYLPTIKAAVPININLPANPEPTIQKIQGPDIVTITRAIGNIDRLTVTEVDETGKLVVNAVADLTRFVVNNTNDGSITVNAVTTDRVDIENNTGSISFNTGTFGNTGLTLPIIVPPLGPKTGVNSGTIAITVSNVFNGPVEVDANTNIGTITIDTSGAVTNSIGADVTVNNNSGTLNLVTAALVPAGVIDVPINTGTINFTKNINIAQTAGNTTLVRSPANNGSGTINFQGTVTTAGVFGDPTNTPATAGNKIAGTGKVVFSDTVTLGGTTVIETNVEFNGNVGSAASPLTFDGDVTLAYQKAITLGAAAATATLKRGSRVLVAVPDTPVLIAGTDVVLTPPGTGTILTAGSLPTGDEENYLGDKTLTLTTALASYTGNLRIAGEGVLEVNTASGITASAAGLTLDAGGILAFAAVAGANVGNTYTVDLSANIKIFGDDILQSRLTAVGGPVTFTPGKISGSGSLQIVPEFGDANISVDGAATLEIAGVNLDLFGNGHLTFVTGAANIVKLIGGTNPGKITLGESSDSQTTTTALDGKHVGTANLLLSGRGVVSGDIEPDTGLGPIGEISAQAPFGDLTLTGDAGANEVLDNTGLELIL